MEIQNELKKLVAIDSQYPHEQKLAEYVFGYLKKAGFKVKKQFIDATRFNVLAEKGTGKKSVLFYAHLDTVGVATGWKTDPLKLTIAGDKAYGLGVWDMKAGLLVNSIAAQSSNLKNTKIKVVFCVDEEYISKGGHALIHSPFMEDVQCVISTEPAFQYGVQGIVTGRIGRAVYDCELTTASAHFAKYEPGIDLNIMYAEFVTFLKKLYKKNGDKKQFVFVRSVESKVVGLSIPEKITFQLDSSLLPPQSTESILKVLRAKAKLMQDKYQNGFHMDINLHKRETPFLQPYVLSPKNTYLSKLKKSIFAVTKKAAVPYFRSSVADENIFGASGITTLGIGPVGGNAHAANEWVSLSSIQELVRILTHFISCLDEL